MMNPLLDFSGLPRFADIRIEHITPAVKQLLADGRNTIERIRDDASHADLAEFRATDNRRQ